MNYSIYYVGVWGYLNSFQQYTDNAEPSRWNHLKLHQKVAKPTS